MCRTTMTHAFAIASAMAFAAGAGCTGEAVTLESAALDQQEIIEELASAPAFRSYVTSALALQARSAEALAAMTPAERAVFEAEATALLADARLPGATFGELAGRMTELTGVTAAELQAVGIRAANLAQLYPQLPESGPALFGQVLQHDPELDALLRSSGSGDEDPPDEELEDCYQDCHEEYFWDHAKAITTFQLQAAGCTQGGLFGPVCWMVAWIQYELAEAAAQDALDDCLAICRGEDPDVACDDDKDCDPDEWCDHGTLGFGENECKPDKFIGEVCSRDAKCLSGCCKYDFWQHPFSMTCNPASDC